MARLAVALLLLLAAILPVAAAESLEARAARVLSDLGAQTRLPENSGAEPPSARRFDDHLIPPTSPKLPDSDAKPSAPARWEIPSGDAAAMLWLAGIGALLCVVWALRGKLRRRAPGEVVAAAAGPPVPATPRRDDDVEEADALARAGRLAEAMHVLLLQAIAELRGRFGALPRSLTSREIAGRVPLSEGGRMAFAELVRQVERGYFGAHSVSEGDYRACRDNRVRLRQSFADGIDP